MPSSKKRKLTVHDRKRTHPATSEDDMVTDLNSGIAFPEYEKSFFAIAF